MKSRLCRLDTFAAFLLFIGCPAFTAASNDTEVWQCPGPDDTPLFTNKERPGCQPMELRPLSTAPALPDMTDRPVPGAEPVQRYDAPSQTDGFSYDTPAGALRNLQSIPDWAREWQASTRLSGSTQAEICSMYGEWLRLNEKSRGGFFFGTDPSYGGDPTARSFRAPSFSFYDNARWVALSRMFGTGFVPIGCP